MIKNQLYPYIESYINEFLYGFTKEQLDVGVMNGQIKLENLNLRPDGINQQMDDMNLPFWLKAGLISKIDIGCSIMNFIGEKPLEINIEGLDIIITPSYKWILKNIDSFILENKLQMKCKYDPNDNNSMDIFTKKINVLDNSIFKKEYIEEIFKDKTKISAAINKFFKFCYKFYYSKNFSINLCIKNIHIRFEDDQLINYTGDIAFGCKIDSLELILSSEGVMKRDSFKINKLNIYWESPAKILIPSDLLNSSIKDGKLDENYYTNLKKIKFQQFKYTSNTKFLIENFSCRIKFGTKVVNLGKIDLFSKSSNDYNFFFQFISNEIILNFFPDLLVINDNFNKFLSEFSIIEQVQDFKPMKKPYNVASKNYIEFIETITKHNNPKFYNNFMKKKKMIVRDWLFYFYWCQKCKLSLIGKKVNPLRLEFSRFYNLCFSNKNDFGSEFNTLENKENNKNKESNKKNEAGTEDYNPDKVNISFTSEMLIKGFNINLHPLIKSENIDFTSMKINGIEIKIILLKTKFDFDITSKSIIFGPNKLSIGEKVFISNSSRKKKEQMNNIQLNYGTNDYLESSYSKILSNIEENTGLSGLIQKYNPNYKLKLKIIDDAIEKIGNKKKIYNLNESEISMINSNKYNSSQYNDAINYSNLNDSKVDINSNFFIKMNTSKGTETKGLGKRRHYLTKRNSSFANNILSNFDGTPLVQKIELKRQKNNFSIGQAINDYNLKKAKQRVSFNSMNNNIMNNSVNNIMNSSNYILSSSNKSNQSLMTSRKKTSLTNISLQNKYKSKGPETQIISTGENIPINLFEINSKENDKALSFGFIKYNNESKIDSISLKLGVIRFNLFSQYISTCLGVISDYQTILNQPIIKSIQKYENGIMMQKQLFNMKKYILNYIQRLPENKKNEHIKKYLKFLEKEIEIGKKYGIDSDSYEINYLFNFFPKGIEIICDYDIFECVYYNSKKNNKISGKAILPSPEFCFKLDPDKIGIKFFDFEFEIEDLDDLKHIMTQVWKIIQDKIKVAKLFIEPCLAQARIDLEKKQNKQKENWHENIKIIKDKNMIDINSKFPLFENIKNKNKNNINSLNSKTNTTELTLTNNINEVNTINHANAIGKKNLTYTAGNINNNFIRNIEKNLNLEKNKNDKSEEIAVQDDKKVIIPTLDEENESEDKKTCNQNEEIEDKKNLSNHPQDEKSQKNGNKYVNKEIMNINERINGK